MLIAIGVLMTVAIGTVIVGVIADRGKRTMTERLDGKDRVTYIASRRMKEGIILCPSCLNEYDPGVKNMPVCVICTGVSTEPVAPEKRVSWAERHPAVAVGYVPLQDRPGFEDFYKGDEYEN